MSTLSPVPRPGRNPPSADAFLRDLDVSVFDGIPSQTSPDDRKSLLALQAAIRSKHSTYAYLEIGSFLGGSLQPYVLDPACTAIYSVDIRCEIAPDERDDGSSVEYQENTSEHMLKLLARIDPISVKKVICCDGKSSVALARKFDVPPVIAFIDGEHTNEAVLADFAACRKVVASNCIIAFHDSYLIYPALREIGQSLRREGRQFEYLKLGGSVSAIVFDLELLEREPRIRALERDSRAAWRRFSARQEIKRVTPRPLFRALKRAFGA